MARAEFFSPNSQQTTCVLLAKTTPHGYPSQQGGWGQGHLAFSALLGKLVGAKGSETAVP